MRIEFRGWDEFERRMNALGQVGVWAKPIMDRAVKYVHSQVPSYPSPPSTSRYRRTGTLGRTITTEVRSLTGNDVVGSIGTRTVYAPWVISSEKGKDGRGPQAKVHKGRWYTLQGVVMGQADRVRQIFETEIRKLLN